MAPEPRRLYLDGNVYDFLKGDEETRDLLSRCIAEGRVVVLVTPKVRDELLASPFGGIPTWFPVVEAIESVAVLNHWHLGEAALGEGEVFTAHRGGSKKVADAIIADSAASYADVLVSHDGRLRNRFAAIAKERTALDTTDLNTWLKNLP